MPDASLQRPGPSGNDGQRVRFLRQKRPQNRMVPAQVVAIAVAMGADTVARHIDCRNKLLGRQVIGIFIHVTSAVSREPSACEANGHAEFVRHSEVGRENRIECVRSKVTNEAPQDQCREPANQRNCGRELDAEGQFRASRVCLQPFTGNGQAKE